MTKKNKAILHRAENYVVQPWKNGGGQTTEVARAGAGADFLWRLSIADIRQDGPFSDFSGLDRSLMLLDGPGIHLDFPAQQKTHTFRKPYTWLAFDGAAAVDCRLIDGPTRDFNVMTRQGKVTHDLQLLAPVTEGYRLIRATPATLLIFCLEGSLSAHVTDETHILQAHDLLELRATTEDAVILEPCPEAACAIITVQDCEIG